MILLPFYIDSEHCPNGLSRVLFILQVVGPLEQVVHRMLRFVLCIVALSLRLVGNTAWSPCNEIFVRAWLAELQHRGLTGLEPTLESRFRQNEAQAAFSTIFSSGQFSVVAGFFQENGILSVHRCPKEKSRRSNPGDLVQAISHTDPRMPASSTHSSQRSSYCYVLAACRVWVRARTESLRCAIVT